MIDKELTDAFGPMAEVIQNAFGKDNVLAIFNASGQTRPAELIERMNIAEQIQCYGRALETIAKAVKRCKRLHRQGRGHSRQTDTMFPPVVALGILSTTLPAASEYMTEQERAEASALQEIFPEVMQAATYWLNKGANQ